MKKIYTKSVISLALGILLIHTSNAQNRTINSNSEVAPVSSPATSIVTPNTPDALFDVQFTFRAEDSVPTVSIAGIGIVGGEIWVSRWTGNSIYRFTPTGSYIDSFAVTGVPNVNPPGGVRAITFDGTNAWVSYNGTTIKKIDATTHAVLSTITPPPLTGGTSTTIRWITYDPTLDNGAGGFWIGNYSTDILSINMAGQALAGTIPAGSHGLTAMYGAAYDNLSPGGPFLWINSQADPSGVVSGTTSVIVQLDAASGMLTGIQHNQDTEFNTTGTATPAGGIFVGQLPGLSHSSILAVDQGIIIAVYELTTAAGIKKNEFSSQLNIQPNPSNGLFNVVNKSKISNADVTITNAKGETVYTRHFDNMVSEQVDARHLSKGVYMVTITNEQGKATKSMIIQ